MIFALATKDTTELILSVALPIIGFFVTVLIPVSIKIARLTKRYKLEKTLTFLNEVAQVAIVEAEKHTNYRGAEKKDYALTKINQACIEKRVCFNLEQASQVIEQLVQTTKEINQRDKDKQL